MAESKNGPYRAKKKKAEELLLAQRLPEARAAFAQLCQLDPRDYDAWLNLGAIEGMLGKLDVAEVAFKKALTLRNDESRAYFNLARLCNMQERFDEAFNYWVGYLRLKPDDADGYAQIGRLLYRVGRTAEAVQAMHDALQRNPNEATYYSNIGVMLCQLGRNDEALASYQNALRLKPNMDEAYCNLGNLYHNIGEGELARASYAKALEINPLNAPAHMNLGFHYSRTGCNDEALRCLREALQLQPKYAGAHWNLALLLLLLGRLREGWQEYEWRFQCDEIRRPEIIARLASKPMWNGSPLSGQTLLVYAEQGFGDTLQFCRYLPLVRRRVDRVLFECQPELYRLLSGLFVGIELIQRGSESVLPTISHDLQIPLMSLPRLFETEMETIPEAVPYIHADPLLVEQWRQRFDSSEFKVGLVWAGSPTHQRDQKRSLSLTAFTPLGEIQKISLYSLQKGPVAAEAVTPPNGMHLIDLAPELDDFATTAAVIANLDLVITVDTAVAHLAGAMGKPVWALIYSPPDWRWLLDREDSPWYPTMRLFRQESPGEWGPVIERVALELEKVVSPKIRNIEPLKESPANG